MSKLRLIIVDDHPLVRQGLSRILEREADIDVIGEISDGQVAIDEAEKTRPDVILMDINLPTVNGIQAMRSIKHTNPKVAIITLTAYNNPAQLFHAMRGGASAYYPKEVSPVDLLSGIRIAAQGGYVINGEVKNAKQLHAWLLEQAPTLDPGSSDYPDEMFIPLSGREMEILQQISRGLSNKEIARALGISRQTVKNHMTSILRKLSVNDRTQAALYALRHGWIRLEDTQ